MIKKKVSDRKFTNWFGYVLVDIGHGEGNKALNIETRFNGRTFETSLAEIFEQAKLPKIGNRSVGTILVIYENISFGEIYRFGNGGEYWELVGETCGYA